MRIDSQTIEQMKLWLADGLSPGFVAQGLKLYRFPLGHIWFLTGPVLHLDADQFPPPPELVRAVYAARLETIWQEYRAETLSPLAPAADVAAYLLHHPPELAPIYAYARGKMSAGAQAAPALTAADRSRFRALQVEIRQRVIRQARRRELARPGSTYLSPIPPLFELMNQYRGKK